MAFFEYPSGSEEAVGDAGFMAKASDDDWAALRSHCELRQVRAGEDAIVAGAVERALYIVLQGELGILVPDGSHWRQVASIGQASVFGR